MGHLINVRGDFSGVNMREVRSVLKQLLVDATGEEASRVIYHTSAAQTPAETFRELTRLTRESES